MNAIGLSSLRPILVGGLIAGTVDIGAASLINILNPVVILHFIATGILGQAALSAGAGVTWLGLILQWAMSVIIAAIYFIVTAWLPTLRRKWVLGGLLSGIVIFLVMNFVVVPLSAAPVTFRDAVMRIHTLKAAENLIAMFVFGLIVSFVASRGGEGQLSAGVPAGASRRVGE
jgi:uncharacterized membrane protein YagU involved in acid resistance